MLEVAMRASIFWLGPILVLLAGCTAILPLPAILSAPAAADPTAPLIGPGQRLNLPRPADLGRSAVATQLITASGYGQTFVLEVNLSVTPERVTLVGLDGIGRRAITIAWTDQNVTAEVAPWVPETLRPGSMLADIIVIYWPEAAVRRALPAGGELIQEPRGRTIRIDGNDVLRVDYGWAAGARWNGTLRYSNLAWGYEIEVQSSEVRR
jgi:Protein of unknown function (DUF3261)